MSQSSFTFFVVVGWNSLPLTNGLHPCVQQPFATADFWILRENSRPQYVNIDEQLQPLQKKSTMFDREEPLHPGNRISTEYQTEHLQREGCLRVHLSNIHHAFCQFSFQGAKLCRVPRIPRLCRKSFTWRVCLTTWRDQERTERMWQRDCQCLMLNK